MIAQLIGLAPGKGPDAGQSAVGGESSEAADGFGELLGGLMRQLKPGRDGQAKADGEKAMQGVDIHVDATDAKADAPSGEDAKAAAGKAGKDVLLQAKFQLKADGEAEAVLLLGEPGDLKTAAADEVADADVLAEGKVKAVVGIDKQADASPEAGNPGTVDAPPLKQDLPVQTADVTLDTASKNTDEGADVDAQARKMDAAEADKADSEKALPKQEAAIAGTTRQPSAGQAEQLVAAAAAEGTDRSKVKNADADSVVKTGPAGEAQPGEAKPDGQHQRQTQQRGSLIADYHREKALASSYFSKPAAAPRIHVSNSEESQPVNGGVQPSELGALDASSKAEAASGNAEVAKLLEKAQAEQGKQPANPANVNNTKVPVVPTAADSSEALPVEKQVIRQQAVTAEPESAASLSGPVMKGVMREASLKDVQLAGVLPESGLPELKNFSKQLDTIRQTGQTERPAESSAADDVLPEPGAKPAADWDGDVEIESLVHKPAADVAAAEHRPAHGMQQSGQLPQDSVDAAQSVRIDSVLPKGLKPDGASHAAGREPVLNASAGPLSRQVAEGVSYGMESGYKRLTIKLNPEHLGDVRISLTSDASQQLSARLIVSSRESHDMLTAQLNQLKGSLEAQGVNVDRLTVVLAGNTENNANAQNQAGQNQPGGFENGQQQAQQQQNGNSSYQQAQQQAFDASAGQSNGRPQQANNQHGGGDPAGGDAELPEGVVAPADEPGRGPVPHENGNVSILA